MKSEYKTLTYQQAKDLKFFCQNVLGVRQDMYDTIHKTNSFDERINRLEKTAEMIEKFLGEKIEATSAYQRNETVGGVYVHRKT